MHMIYIMYTNFAVHSSQNIRDHVDFVSHLNQE